MADPMPKVQVLMSTYNGGHVIERQAKSILNQYGVRVNLLIRDDGSDDLTKKILLNLSERFYDEVAVIFGQNIGWRRSFFGLIKASNEFDYYAFADQDDVWFPNKIINSIKAMSNDNETAQLTHVQSFEVDENLQPMLKRQKKIAKPRSFKMALCTEVFQGCSMVWNAEAMKNIIANIPSSKIIPHDFWVGLVVYILGEIHFVEEPQFYHIRYNENSSTDGNVFKGRIKRVQNLLKGSASYINPSVDLLKSSVSLTEEQREFVEHLQEYKTNTKIKCKLLFDSKFRRPSVLGTLLMKSAILFNRY